MSAGLNKGSHAGHDWVLNKVDMTAGPNNGNHARHDWLVNKVRRDFQELLEVQLRFNMLRVGCARILKNSMNMLHGAAWRCGRLRPTSTSLHQTLLVRLWWLEDAAATCCPVESMRCSFP